MVESSGSNDDNLTMYLVPNVQCFGSPTRDVDLVVLMSDRRETPFESQNRKIRSLCLTIEVKGHPTKSVHFEGNKCFVEYNGFEHDVTTQSEKQKYAFQKYVSENVGPGESPWVTNLIWLRNVPKSQLPRMQHNIIGSDADWQDVLDCAVGTYGRGAEPSDVEAFPDRRSTGLVARLLTKRIEATEMDRYKMEKASQRVLRNEDAQWWNKLGSQLLIFRGRGGTGKTVRLLQLANDLFERQDSRVLLLTYNVALVADLNRLIRLMGLQGGLANRAVSIKSIHSFMYTWLNALGVVRRGQDFLGEYSTWKSEALELIRGGAIERADVQQALAEDSSNLAWDYIMIDESQDWPEDERDILFALYDFRKFVIADGIDQLVRSQHETDWRRYLNRDETQVVPLRKSLRLKENICHFVRDFSMEIEYQWDVDPEPNSFGGRVIVVVGDRGLEREFHEELFEQALNDKNRLVDLLLCVPHHWIKFEGADRRSIIAEHLSEWGYDTWDAVDATIRKSYPRNLDQLRIVQYDSCRGLEGWVVFNYALDEFFEHKRKFFVDESKQEDFLADPDAGALLFAKQWLMIPLTRAIDTLVLHVESEDSPIGRVLSRMKDRDNITWIE